MDKMHRDRIAFLRVTSGRFERGMAAKHLRAVARRAVVAPAPFSSARSASRSKRPTRADVIGLINPGMFPGRRRAQLGPDLRGAQLPALRAGDLRPGGAARTVDGQGLRQGPRAARRRRRRAGVSGRATARASRSSVRSANCSSRCSSGGWKNEYGVELRLDRKQWTRARWLVDVTDELLEILPMVVKDEVGRFVALFHSEFEIDYAKSRYKGPAAARDAAGGRRSRLISAARGAGSAALPVAAGGPAATRRWPRQRASRSGARHPSASARSAATAVRTP